MPSDRTDPLWVERAEPVDALEVYRQAPPPGSASVSISFLAPGGWAYDPAGEEGCAQMAAQLMTCGAGRLDRVSLARRLDALGGSLTSRCHPESSEVTVWGPTGAYPALLGILADATLRPRFDAREVERVRRQMFERQLREASQPASRAERALFEHVFPTGHPYRLSGIGTRRSVGRLTAERLRRFRREHYTRAGGTVVVTAPCLADAVRRHAARAFRGFDRDGAPDLPARPDPPPPRPQRHDVAMAGRAQVEIRIGGPSIARSADEFPAAYLANEVLGGRPLLARLFQRVRERHGLAYHASSELEAMAWGGYWLAQAGTGPERATRTVALVQKEVRRMRDELVPPAELDEIRDSAIGELPLDLEDTSSAHTLALDVAYHHLAPDFYRTWSTVLRSVTPAQVRRAAQVGLDGAHAVTVLAGPALPRG
ncbi:MAG: M16 family metallopeptidase [Thermoplasmata archaeon]